MACEFRLGIVTEWMPTDMHACVLQRPCSNSHSRGGHSTPIPAAAEGSRMGVNTCRPRTAMWTNPQHDMGPRQRGTKFAKWHNKALPSAREWAAMSHSLMQAWLQGFVPEREVTEPSTQAW